MGGAFQDATSWPRVEALPGVERRVVACGEQLMLVEWHIASGATIPLHTHPHEQIGHVVSGKLRFHIGDDVREIAAGDGYAIPGGVPHGCTAVEDTVAVDSFHPVREDYR